MPVPSQFLLFGNYVTIWCLLVETKKSSYLCAQLKLVAKMLTLGIAQTSLALLSLNRIFASSKGK